MATKLAVLTKWDADANGITLGKSYCIDTLSKCFRDDRGVTRNERWGEWESVAGLKPYGDVSENLLLVPSEQPKDNAQPASGNKYLKSLTDRNGVTVVVDVYDVIKAFKVTCPALQHLIKKALNAGNRGHKDLSVDLQDIIDSALRAKQLNQ